METFIVIGAGGHGAEVACYALQIGLPLLGSIDDGKPSGAWRGTQILGGIEKLPEICADHYSVRYITAFGGNALRKSVVSRINSLNLRNLTPYSLLHPSAFLGNDNEIREGTLIAPHSLLTTNVLIGRHCILNVKASVSHDSVIGDWCNLNPGATICGNVSIGQHCYIGANATILERIRIGDDVIIGAGAVVTRDLPSGVTVVGVPAKIIRSSPHEYPEPASHA